MLSSYLSTFISTAEMRITMGSNHLEFTDKAAAILSSIDETKKIVHDIVINKANFLVMAIHLSELRPLLEDLTQHRDLFDSSDTKLALYKLAIVAEKVFTLTKCGTVRSRIYLVYKSGEYLQNIRDLTKDLVDCLNVFPVFLSGTLEKYVTELRSKLQSTAFFLDPGLEQLTRALAFGVEKCQTDEPYATSLLRSIAEFLQLPLSAAAELKVELEDDLSNAERENWESDIQVLTDLCQLLRPAAVLADVRRLASQRFFPLSPERCTPIPSSFICPITKQVMQEPVMILEAGYTYEKSAILEWFDRGNRTCPDTGKELESLEIVPNLNLRQAMEEFFDRRGQETLILAMEKITTDSCAEHEEAVHLIKSLIDADSKYKRRVVALDGLKPLVTVLRRAAPALKEKILRILCGIAAVGEEQKVLLKEAGAVPVLLRIINRNPGEHGGAVQLLWELSRCEAGKAAILAEPLSVVTIASALTHCTGDQKKLLNDLCQGNSRVVIEVAHAGVFGPLVATLGPGNDMAVRSEMAKAVCNLELNEHTSSALVQAGAVPPLLDLLQQGNMDVKIAAAEALRHLSDCDSNRVAISKTGAIPVLVSYLDSSCEDLSQAVVGTLANLATHRGNVEQMEPQGATLRLVEMVTCGEKMVKEYAMRTLQCMAKDCRPVRLALKDCSEVIGIFSLLQDGDLSSAARMSIISLICHLAGDRYSRSCVILSKEVLRILMALLEQPAALLEQPAPLEEREAILSILASLSKLEEMRSRLLHEPSVLRGLVKCLDKPSSAKIKENAAVALSKLLHLTPVHVKLSLARQGMVSLLLDLLSSGSERSKQHAAVALGILSMSTPDLTECQSVFKRFMAALGMRKYRTCRVHAGKCSAKGTFCVIEAGAVPHLINLVREGGSSSEDALEALFTLVHDRATEVRAIDYLVKQNVVPPIINMVVKNPISTEKAVTLLEKIFQFRRHRDQRYVASAKSSLLVTMTNGTNDARKAAAKALMHLDVMPKNSTYTQST